MHVGIDCRAIALPDGSSGGIGMYTHQLTAALAALVQEEGKDRLTLFFDSADAAAVKREFHQWRELITARVIPFRGIAKLPFVRSQIVAAKFFERERLDVLHGPANVTPLYYRGKTVVTLHDAAVYDHPEWFPSALPGTGSFARRVTVPASLQKASRVITPSNATRNDLARLKLAAAEKIDVVPEAAAFDLLPEDSWSDIRTRAELRANGYVLALSTIEPRKNLAALADGFTLAAQSGGVPDGMALAVAGPQGWKTEETFAALARAQRALGAARVKYLGPVNEADKVALLKNAAALAYPSHSEGFGLPPLEAMLLSTAVLISPAPALEEVCGDAALKAGGYDANALAAALTELFRDPAATAERVKRGMERAATFTWERAARETMDVYRKAVSA